MIKTNSIGKDCIACSATDKSQQVRRNVCNCYQITDEQMQRIFGTIDLPIGRTTNLEHMHPLFAT
jgi:hypothetical protein